jgi:hypothetical protein
MASRHNRKRTRSRPRNRTSALKSRSLINSSSSSTLNSPLPSQTQLPTGHWQKQYTQWQDRIREQHQSSTVREQAEAAAAEAQRLRIFGGVAGDEVSLCAPMLQVVMGLFGGLDYDDP